MTKTNLTPIAVTAVIIALAGCNSSGKTEGYKPKAQEKVAPTQIVAGQEQDLFPVKAGNEWVYEGESLAQTPTGNKTNKSIVTFRCVDVADTPEGKVATLEIISDDKLSDRLKWRVGQDGIYQVSGSIRETAASELKEVRFEPTVPVVPFPIRDESETKVSATGIRPGAGRGPFTSKIKVEGIQEVDSAMGRFSALGATSEMNYKEKNITFRAVTTAYWTPKVGIVRYVQEVIAANDQGKSLSSTSILRLKSHTP